MSQKSNALERFLLVSLLLLGWTVADANAAERAKPNIVFILADDLGWTDTATYGSKYYETPNIDRLAAQGMKLTRYHNCQNCQPTRAALMSGQYAPRTGVYTVGGINRFAWQSRPLRPVDNVTALPLDQITIAQALKKAGYATGLFGKWHLGGEPPIIRASAASTRPSPPWSSISISRRSRPSIIPKTLISPTG